MNAASSNNEEHEFNYGSSQRTRKNSAPNASRRTNANARRRGKSPEQFNGMHRRRRKKLDW